jgi:citrate lyase beta subunit
MLRLAGVTDMEDRVAEGTVMTVVPKVGPEEKLLGMVEVAVMVVKPAAIAVAWPLLLIVATVGSDELQVTCEDISWVVWSFQ